jgi:hypothetical protein
MYAIKPNLSISELESNYLTEFYKANFMQLFQVYDDHVHDKVNSVYKLLMKIFIIHSFYQILMMKGHYSRHL